MFLRDGICGVICWWQRVWPLKPSKQPRHAVLRKEERDRSDSRSDGRWFWCFMTWEVDYSMTQDGSICAEDSSKDTTSTSKICCTPVGPVSWKAWSWRGSNLPFFQEMEVEEVGPLVGQRNLWRNWAVESEMWLLRPIVSNIFCCFLPEKRTKIRDAILIWFGGTPHPLTVK